MTKNISIAVVGATGIVGETLIELLEQRDFPFETLYLLAAGDAAGKRIQFKGQNLVVEDIDKFDFKKVRLAFFCAPGHVAKQFAPLAQQAGCTVIDSSAHFRGQDNVPVVIPEVNAEILEQCEYPALISNPGSATIPLLMALKPIHDAAGLKNINVASLYSVSCLGKSAVEELAGQTARLLNAQPIESKVFSDQIAFNVLPQIGALESDGNSEEENRLIEDCENILRQQDIVINTTAISVPVFFGVANAVSFETRQATSLEQLQNLLQNREGVEFVDDKNGATGPNFVSDVSGEDAVKVGRLRQSTVNENMFNIWIATDNSRKGSALNSVQIAEILVKHYL